jgi:hypothetical protein
MLPKEGGVPLRGHELEVPRMLKAICPVPVLLAGVSLLAAAPAPDVKPKAGYAKKDGLSLTVTLDKKTYRPDDEIDLRFALKNESNKVLFVGDGFLGPDYHEAGPGRHFEVHVKAGGKDSLFFWSGTATEGTTSGIRKVFRLKPGEQYKGSIRLSAGSEKDQKRAELPHAQRGGSFEDEASRKRHVLGNDGTRYTVEVRYQVDPNSHGVWMPPEDFKNELLWKGSLTTAPLEFAVLLK